MALLTALLVAGLVSMLAVAMMSRQQVDIRRTVNLLDQDRALLLAQGLESVAVQELLRDADADRLHALLDFPNEDWALEFSLPEELEGVSARGVTIDLQGRFNLNNLVANDSIANDTIRAAFSVTQFQRLLALCELEPELWQPVADWLDNDTMPLSPNGAEDETYLELEPPYLPANRKMVSLTELRLVAASELHLADTGGFNSQGLKCLAELVTVLPEVTAINVNTAPAKVIASLDPDISLSQAESLVELRPETGYAGVEEFIRLPLFAGTRLQEQMHALAVHSSYFLTESKVVAGRGQVSLYSVLHRKIWADRSEVKVTARSRGVY